MGHPVWTPWKSGFNIKCKEYDVLLMMVPRTRRTRDRGFLPSSDCIIAATRHSPLATCPQLPHIPPCPRPRCTRWRSWWRGRARRARPWSPTSCRTPRRAWAGSTGPQWGSGYSSSRCRASSSTTRSAATTTWVLTRASNVSSRNLKLYHEKGPNYVNY